MDINAGKCSGWGPNIVAEMKIRNGTHTNWQSFPRKDAPNHSVFPIKNKFESIFQDTLLLEFFFFFANSYDMSKWEINWKSRLLKEKILWLHDENKLIVILKCTG